MNAIADYLFSPPPSVNNKREKTGRYEQKIVLIVEGPPSSYISKKEGGNYFYFFKISTFLSGSLFRAGPFLGRSPEAHDSCASLDKTALHTGGGWYEKGMR